MAYSRKTFTAWRPRITPEKLTNHRTNATLADGCDVSRPGNITYQIVRELVDGIVLVSEDEIREAVLLALIQRNKVITEGAGR